MQRRLEAAYFSQFGGLSTVLNKQQQKMLKKQLRLQQKTRRARIRPTTKFDEEQDAAYFLTELQEFQQHLQQEHHQLPRIFTELIDTSIKKVTTFVQNKRIPSLFMLNPIVSLLAVIYLYKMNSYTTNATNATNRVIIQHRRDINQWWYQIRTIVQTFRPNLQYTIFDVVRYARYLSNELSTFPDLQILNTISQSDAKTKLIMVDAGVIDVSEESKNKCVVHQFNPYEFELPVDLPPHVPNQPTLTVVVKEARSDSTSTVTVPLYRYDSLQDILVRVAARKFARMYQLRVISVPSIDTSSEKTFTKTKGGVTTTITLVTKQEVRWSYNPLREMRENIVMMYDSCTLVNRNLREELTSNDTLVRLHALQAIAHHLYTLLQSYYAAILHYQSYVELPPMASEVDKEVGRITQGKLLQEFNKSIQSLLGNLRKDEKFENAITTQISEMLTTFADRDRITLLQKLEAFQQNVLSTLTTIEDKQSLYDVYVQVVADWMGVDAKRRDHQTQYNNIEYEKCLQRIPNLLHMSTKEYKLRGRMTFSMLFTTVDFLLDQIECNRWLPYAQTRNSYVKALNNIHIPTKWFEELMPTTEEDETTASGSQRYDERTHVVKCIVCHVDQPTVKQDEFSDRSEFTFVTIELVKDEMIMDAFVQNVTITYEVTDQSLLPILQARVIEYVLLPLRSAQPSTQPQPLVINATTEIAHAVSLLQLPSDAAQSINIPILHDFAMNNLLTQSTVTFRERRAIYTEGESKFKLSLNEYEDQDVDGFLYYRVPESDRPDRLVIKTKEPMWTLHLQAIDSQLPNLQHATRLAQKFQVCMYLVYEQSLAFTYRYYCHFIADCAALLDEMNQQQLFLERNLTYRDVFTLSMVKKVNPDYRVPFIRTYAEVERATAAGSGVVYEQMQQLQLSEQTRGKNWLYFPYYDPQTIEEKSDSYVFACEPSKFIHLRHDERDDANFIGIPVCVSKQDSDNLVQLYKNVGFVNNVTFKTRGAAASNLILTKNKFLSPNRVGELPPRLTTLLRYCSIGVGSNVSVDALKQDAQQMFYRTGVEGSVNDRVLYALHKAINDTVATPDDIRKYKSYLKEKGHAGLALSSGVSSEDAVRIIDEGLYIDPRAWMAVLRELFDVEMVFLCQHHFKNNKGSLCSEYFQKYRIGVPRDQFKRNTVVLYLTHGSEQELTKNAVTELVFVADKSYDNLTFSSKFQTLFETSSMFASALSKCCDDMYPTKRIDIGHLRTVEWKSQSVDTYDKTRVLTTSSPEVSLITTPILNVQSQQGTDSDVYLANFYNSATRQTLIRLLNLQTLAEFVFVVYPPIPIDEDKMNPKFANNKVIGLWSQSKSDASTQLFVPIDQLQFGVLQNLVRQNQLQTLNVLDMTKYNYMTPVKTGRSFSVTFNVWERIANCLFAYMLFLFSVFMQHHALSKPSKVREDTTLKWITDHTELVVGATYDETSMTPLIEPLNNTFVQETNGVYKLLVKAPTLFEAQSIRQKLHYALQQALHDSFGFVLSYYARTSIHNYYNSANVFRSSNAFSVYSDHQTYLDASQSPYAKYAVEPQFLSTFTQAYFVRVLSSTDGLQTLLVIAATSTPQEAIQRIAKYATQGDEKVEDERVNTVVKVELFANVDDHIQTVRATQIQVQLPSKLANPPSTTIYRLGAIQTPTPMIFALVKL